MLTFIDPYTDFGFKKLFGEEKNKKLLISFLNDVLGDKETIVDLTFKNSEKLPDSSQQRKAVFDIFCTNDNDEHFVVEMQKAKQNYFKDRSIYYTTFPIQEQAKKGNWNFKLKAVYCIGILDFTFNPHNKDPQVIHTVQLKNQNNQVFYDKLKYIYIEMPNFNKTLEQLDSHFDRWLYFLKNLSSLEDIPELFLGDIIYQGFETARIAALDKEEQAHYQRSLKEYRDLFNVIETSKQEGLDEAQKRISLELLRSGLLTHQQIAKTTQLTIEQVVQLSKNLDDS
ncbi:MAG: putative transposase/invertase (TIGR01784 family) [Phenylobacterium sp.]|jgi:predicted transposase/invertase (TIGR01784 family)